MTTIAPKHFLWSVEKGVAVITLNRPEKKNPLTFDSYRELADTFNAAGSVDEIKTIIVQGAEGNFCSGGDVHEIIGPLVKMNERELNDFTKMTGDLVIAMRRCPKVIIAAIDGVCVGGGAAVAMAADFRYGTERSKVAFLFVKVGLAGCDMGACAMLPRIIGWGRASELLYTGRSMDGNESLMTGFYNKLCHPDELLEQAKQLAAKVGAGPTKAHAMTKDMLNKEWNMELFAAIDAEAKAQATCMQTNDFKRAYEAFVRKETPKFEGN